MQEDKIAKRNFILNIFRQALWGLGNSFVVESTIIMIFLTHFTDSKVVIALLATIPALSGAIMPIISEYFTKDIHPKKTPMSLLVVLSQLCWVGIAIFAFTSRSFTPSGVLIAFFILYAVSSIIMGVTTPMHFTFVAKVIPKNRGAFFGIGSVSLGIFGIIGAIFAKTILEKYSFPANFALCFLIAAIIRAVHVVFIMASVEQEIPVKQENNKFHLYLKELIELIRKNKKYRNLIAVQIAVSLSTMGTVFYAVYIKSVIEMTPTVIGMITIFGISGGMVASVISGLLGDVKGHRLTYAAALCGSIITVLIALFGKTVNHFYLMFFLGGASGGTASVAYSALMMDMAPKGLSGRYFAVSSTVLAPFAALAPMIGGILIEKTSYTFVFFLTAIFLFISLVMFLRGKEEPHQNS